MIPPIMPEPDTDKNVVAYGFIALVMAGGFVLAWGISSLITGHNTMVPLISLYS